MDEKYDFINDFIDNSIEEIQELRESINDIDKEYFISVIRKLSSYSQLIGFEHINPFFDSVIQIADLSNPQKTEDYRRHFECIEKIISSLLKKLKVISIQFYNEDENIDLKMELEEDLIAEIDEISAQKEETDDEAHDVQEIVSEYVKEGTALVEELKNSLSDFRDDKDGVGYFKQILLMLKGNSDVIEKSNNPDSPSVQKFTLLLDLLQFVLDSQIESKGYLPEKIVNQFQQAIEAFGKFLKNLEDPDFLVKNYNDLINSLKSFENKSGSKNKDKSIKELETPNTSETESQFISINIEKVEDLGNLTGELIVAKNAFNNLKRLINDGDIQKSFEFLKKTENSFHRIISDLDTLIMQMRMQKVNVLFQRFPRMVRDLSRKMEKSIDIKFKGEDTKIDNRILKIVTDPMMHLVRNSLDHGIEIPEKREEKGKDPKGIISLSARNSDGRTYVEIYDDGKGLDPVSLKEKVVKKGLIKEEKASQMTDKEALRLIFLPGFSTAEQVSEVSGRGVGMDVVLSSIESINGTVEIESKVNQFTKITLSFPLTISVSRGLKVHFEKDLFIIPMDDILKMTAVQSSQIHSSKDMIFTKIDDKIHTVIPLNRLLGYRSPISFDTEKIVNLVIIKNGKDTAAIAVDEILGIEEIVVKSMPEVNSALNEFYCGCSILSDGRVVLILNTGKIMRTGELHDRKFCK